jgi:hypothetical protein
MKQNFLLFKYETPDAEKFADLFSEDAHIEVRCQGLVDFKGSKSEYMENMKKYHFGNFILKQMRCVNDEIITLQYRQGRGLSEEKGLYEYIERDVLETNAEGKIVALKSVFTKRNKILE